MQRAKPRIVVIGSINMDLVIRCETLPVPGETVVAHDSSEVCGGKGANQAVAAARAGGSVTMVGRVGDDAFANRLIKNLAANEIDTANVQRTKNCTSGLAIVVVEASAQNSIVAIAGANGKLNTNDVIAATSAIEACDVLLLQWEIPFDSLLVAIQIAKRAGVRVLVDPAPVPQSVRCQGSVDEWRATLAVDLICPNETEAALLTGQSVSSIREVEAAARKLHGFGAANVAITLGERGTMLFDGDQMKLIEPFPVKAIDTTAAGDAFAGALAVRWHETSDLAAAIRFANAAGAIAASCLGAQPSIGRRHQIDRLAECNTD